MGPSWTSSGWLFVMVASDRALRFGSGKGCMDDGVQRFMRAMDDGFPAVETMTPQEARAVLVGRRVPVANLDDVASADDRVIPGPGGDVPVRIYRPHGDSGPRPAVVFCHGGGFVLCDLDSHDGFCRAMSRHTETVVVVGGLPARAGASRARGRAGRVRRVVLGDGPRRRTRHRPGQGADRRGQRGRQPGRRHRADVPRARGAACPTGQVLIYPVIDPSFDTESYRRVRERVRQHLGRDAVVLAAVPRRRQAAVTCVSGGTGARRIARGAAARGRRDRRVSTCCTARARRMRSGCAPRMCLWCIAITRGCFTAS